MNSPATDLIQYLDDEGIGAIDLGALGPGAGVGLFVGQMAPEPSEAVCIHMYGGLPDDTLECARLDRFRVQVQCRARTYKAAWELAMQVEGALDRLMDFEVPDGSSAVKYSAVLRLAPAAELKRDEKHRQIMSQNYQGMRQLI